MEVFNRLLGPDGGAGRHRQKSRDLERSGLRHLQDGSLFEARADLQKAASLDPHNAALRGHLAQVLSALDQLKDADKEFRAAIMLSPFDRELRFAHAQLLEAMLYLDEAAEEYSFASTLDVSAGRSLIALAFLEAGRGDIRKAEISLLRALERGKRDQHVWAALYDFRLDVLLEEQRTLNRAIGLLAWGYYNEQGDRTIQTAVDGKEVRRRRIAQAIALYSQCMDQHWLDLESYQDMELRRLKARSAHEGRSREAEIDTWIDLLYAWHSAQGPALSDAETSSILHQTSPTSGGSVPAASVSVPAADLPQQVNSSDLDRSDSAEFPAEPPRAAALQPPVAHKAEAGLRHSDIRTNPAKSLKALGLAQLTPVQPTRD